MEAPFEAVEDPRTGRDADPSMPPASTLVARLVAAAPAVVAIAILGAAGSFVFMRTPVALILGPIAGLVAALAIPRPADAAVAAGIGSAGGLALARLVAVPGPEPLPALASGVVGAAVVAACVGAFAAFASSRSPRLRGVLGAGAVCLLVGGVWLAGVRLATTPASDGTTFAGMMSAAPPLSRLTLDEAIYLRYVENLRTGEPYYAMVGRVLKDANEVRIGPVDLTTPFSFRMPTLYRALAWLPAQGIWLVMAVLACATVAVVSAYSLSSRFVPAPFAFAAAGAAASYYGGYSITARLLDTEVWAGVLGLVSVTLLVHAYDRDRPRASLVWAAAAAALAAVAVRELAVAFLIVGLATAFAGRRRLPRAWVPWAVALAAGAGMLAAHIAAARAVIATLDGKPLSPMWFHPDGRGLISAVSRVAGISHVAVPFVWALFAAAVIGVLIGTSGTRRIALALVVVGGATVLAVMYPTGYASGDMVPSYWGDMISATVLACVPLAAARLTRGPRRT